jgi:hypothetical protein
MTLPIQEYYTLGNTLSFLLELMDPTKTPKVPKEIRQKAAHCLNHYPNLNRLEELYEKHLTLYNKIPTRY